MRNSPLRKDYHTNDQYRKTNVYRNKFMQTLKHEVDIYKNLDLR